MFVVRYDERKQTHLVNHTDTAQISINILLDDEFEGGGTRFWNRATQEPFAHVQPTQVGQVLMHSALLNHEGMHVEKGRRTIFVGFLDVDRVNPFVEGTPVTGISWYASWGSLFWLAVGTCQSRLHLTSGIVHLTALFSFSTVICRTNSSKGIMQLITGSIFGRITGGITSIFVHSWELPKCISTSSLMLTSSTRYTIW